MANNFLSRFTRGESLNSGENAQEHSINKTIIIVLLFVFGTVSYFYLFRNYSDIADLFSVQDQKGKTAPNQTDVRMAELRKLVADFPGNFYLGKDFEKADRPALSAPSREGVLEVFFETKIKPEELLAEYTKYLESLGADWTISKLPHDDGSFFVTANKGKVSVVVAARLKNPKLSIITAALIK